MIGCNIPNIEVFQSSFNVETLYFMHVMRPYILQAKFYPKVRKLKVIFYFFANRQSIKKNSNRIQE